MAMEFFVEHATIDAVVDYLPIAPTAPVGGGFGTRRKIFFNFTNYCSYDQYHLVTRTILRIRDVPIWRGSTLGRGGLPRLSLSEQLQPQNRPPPPMKPPSDEPDEPPNEVGPQPPPKPPPIALPSMSPMMMPPIIAPMWSPPP
jgi:hypothetical protein